MEVTECATIDADAAPISSEVQQNLQFLNDACSSVAVRTDKSWWSMLAPGRKLSGDTMLSTPVVVASGNINSTPFLRKLTYANAISMLNGDPNLIFQSYLRGHRAFRATWCFRVELSTTPYIGGVLRAFHWLPGGAYDPSFTVDPDFTSAPAYMAHPGVFIDLATTNAFEFKIPHRALEPAIPIEGQDADNGYFGLVPRIPLNTALAGDAVRYTVYFWLEDVELFGRKAPVGSTSAAVPSGGDRLQGEAKTQGPISGFLLATSRVSDWAGTLVPTMVGYTSALSWMARAGAKVASAFGYSRPLNQTPVRTVVNHAWAHNGTATGVDHGYNLGLFHDTQVIPAPVAGLPADELSIAYLASRYHPLTTRNLPTTFAMGTLFMKGTLNPMALMTTYTGAQVTPRLWSNNAGIAAGTSVYSFWPSAAMWCASHFTYWRGGFHFRLILSKTRFHSGKLLFTWDYNPREMTVDSDSCFIPTYTNTQYCHSVLIDLREGNVVDIHIPWEYTGPMAAMNTMIGTWSIWVVEPLVAPDSVKTSIGVAIEGCMTEDTVFGGPRESCLVPVHRDTFAYASGGDRRVDLLAATFGEDITSVKQLAMVASPTDSATPTTTKVWGYPAIVRGSATWPSVSRWPVLWSLRQMFRMERGAVALIVAPPSTATSSDVVTAVSSTYSGVGGPRITPLTRVVTPASEYPRYVVQRYAPLGAVHTGTGAPNNFPSLSRWVVRTIAVTAPDGSTEYVSAADDTSFHGFVGVGQCVCGSIAGYGES